MAMSEQPETASQLLIDILRETRQFGLLRLEFECELAAAALKKKTGHRDTAYTRLAGSRPEQVPTASPESSTKPNYYADEYPPVDLTRRSR